MWFALALTYSSLRARKSAGTPCADLSITSDLLPALHNDTGLLGCCSVWSAGHKGREQAENIPLYGIPNPNLFTFRRDVRGNMSKHLESVSESVRP